MDDLLGMTEAGLRGWAMAQGLPAFRGSQLFTALQRRSATGGADFAVLPPALRERLAAAGAAALPTEGKRREAADGTVKSLLILGDGAAVECVSLPTAARHSVCVSTQVGCAVGCAFCASGRDGFGRDLTAGEIVAQVLHHQNRRPVTNVVYMGSGEPCFNLDAVVQAIRVLGEPHGLGLGRRRHTISTAGVPAGIRRLAAEEPQVTLALSLHAADDATRSRLVPLNRRWPLAAVLAAVADHAAATGRRPTFEYALLAGINDDAGHLAALAALARTHGAHVNLIPCNPVPGLDGRASTPAAVAAARASLAAAGVNVTIRRRRGSDIDAACGQLARSVRD
jgi:23S rRNA (adenine2503-C2)-methyltransferase